MMSRTDRNVVEAIYRDGVDSIVTLAGGFTGDEWGEPACGEWDRTDTVRHLVGVVDWYHDWLDRAVVGVSTPPFAESEFGQRNAQRIAELSDLSGPDAVARFGERAGAYLDRALDHWDLPYGFPLGTITVGHHLGVAATEWHLHAWDLTTGRVERHEPSASKALFTAVGIAMARCRGGRRGRLLELVVPIAASRAPWPTLLRQSGRTPTRT